MNKYEIAQKTEKALEAVLSTFVYEISKCEGVSTDSWLDSMLAKDDIMERLKTYMQSIQAVCPECECVGYHNHEERGI